jgi:hypothetical protein
MRQLQFRFSGQWQLALLAATLLFTGCASHPSLRPSHWRMPWHRTPPAAPVSVAELGVEAVGEGAAPTLPQYWNRNTLRVDLGGIAGTGALKLHASAVNGWPARIEFSVRPGSMHQLEVRGDKRVVFNVADTPAADGAPQLLALDPAAYSSKTGSLTLSWE